MNNENIFLDNCDRFVYEMQKEKMKEVWDNEYDEIWNSE